MIRLFRALALVCSAALPALSFAQAAPDKLVALSAGNTTFSHAV